MYVSFFILFFLVRSLQGSGRILVAIVIMLTYLVDLELQEECEGVSHFWE